MEGIIYFFLASQTHGKTMVFLSDKGWDIYLQVIVWIVKLITE